MDESDDIVVIEGRLKLNRLAYEGQLWKWRKRYVYLLSDGSLFYYESIRNTSLKTSGSVLPRALGKPRGILPIGECKVSLQGNTFAIQDDKTYETFTFQCSNKKIAAQWFTHLALFANRKKTGRHVRKSSTDLLVPGFCSWCLEDVYHGKVSSSIVGRDSYNCTSCCKRTSPCRFLNCKDFARGRKILDDNFCLVHLNKITSWEIDSGDLRKSSVLEQKGYCTWCNKVTNHRFIAKNFIKRDFLRCKTCNHRTVHCKKCTDGMAKATFTISDKLCGQCDPERVGLQEQVENRFPFGSFAPEHENVDIKFLVDGKETFEEMTAAIESTTQDIYMSFWLMCCVIRVRRNLPPTDDDRLDHILLRKAQEGVKIYVLLWNEPSIMLNNFSKENKEYLEKLSPNIKVLRHPKFTPVIFSHHQKFVVVDQAIAFVGGIDLSWGRYDWDEHIIVDTKTEHWWGVDYYNPHITPPGEFYDINNPDKEFFDRNEVPRMPWHDVDIRVNGNTARDVAWNFIQRWNHHKDNAEETLELRDEVILDDENTGTCVCQVVRSLGPWSGSPDERIEDSIYRSYIEAIENSDYFVYIENQFFVSSYGGTGVTNQIAYALHMRIRKAIKKEEPFVVVVIFPQPEEVGRWAVPTLQRELRTASSLLERLQEESPGIDINNYIQFYQLRSYGYLHDKPVTDQIFVHSKIMIVDDRIAIVGSNNINDRSFLGDRDSELAVVTIDSNEIAITVNGDQIYSVGSAVHDLRVRLWNEHLGYPANNDSVDDPLVAAEEFRNVAIANTKIFEQVFGCIPSNRLRNWNEFMAAREANSIHPDHQNLLTGIQGKLMLHPLHFMGDEPPTTREGIMFSDLFQ